MDYNEKMKKVEGIINEINSGNVDPANIVKMVDEAKKLLKELEEELKQLKIEN